jgi:hypothetical protein
MRLDTVLTVNAIVTIMKKWPKIGLTSPVTQSSSETKQSATDLKTQSIQIRSETSSEFRSKETPISPTKDLSSLSSSSDSQEYSDNITVWSGLQSSHSGDSIRSHLSKSATIALIPLSTPTFQTILLSINSQHFHTSKVN